MSAAVWTDQDRKASKRIAEWRRDPVRFVREVFGVEPDAWQVDTLEAVAHEPKVAMSACKGPGKSCLLAWVVWWFLSSHVDAQVLAVSITADNLKDGLWKELAYWRAKSPLLQRAFELTAERIKSTERPETWWASARSFAKDADPQAQASTLAGFHGRNVLVVLDEIGDYPAGVLPAAEAIFATHGQNAKLVVAGNPTSTQGPLYGIVKRPEGWVVIRITGDPEDPKRSPRISLKWAQDEIERWGRDNPYVKVNILGEFPPAGADQLIAIDDVLRAMDRGLPALTQLSDARVWGVDPSRSARAAADEAALAKRQGVILAPIRTWRGLDGPQLAVEIGKEIMTAEKAQEPPDCIFVDVGGVGASVFDHLKLLGWEHLIVPVDFGGSASDARFLDKRSEMWWAMAEWAHTPTAVLPKDPVLQSELVAPTYRYKVQNKRTGFKLESKDEMKARGVPSPNRADALSLTFAAPVAPMSRHFRRAQERTQFATADYDPLGGA